MQRGAPSPRPGSPSLRMRGLLLLLSVSFTGPAAALELAGAPSRGPLGCPGSKTGRWPSAGQNVRLYSASYRSQKMTADCPKQSLEDPAWF